MPFGPSHRYPAAARGLRQALPRNCSPRAALLGEEDAGGQCLSARGNRIPPGDSAHFPAILTVRQVDSTHRLHAADGLWHAEGPGPILEACIEVLLVVERKPKREKVPVLGIHATTKGCGQSGAWAPSVATAILPAKRQPRKAGSTPRSRGCSKQLGSLRRASTGAAAKISFRLRPVGPGRQRWQAEHLAHRGK